MNSARCTAGVAAALLVGAAGSAQLNTNDMPLNNGGELLFTFSTPSVGAPTGTNPPDLFGGDQFWKVAPREALQCASGTVTLSGMWETYFDADWSSSGSFYDRVISNAYELGGLGGTPACARVPSWVALGATDGSEVLVSLGPAGLPAPCSVSGTCSPGGCPSSGFVTGYAISWSGLAIQVPCDGAQDVAVTYFLPGGMSGTGGACALGDYVWQTEWSTNETQGDCCGDGLSPYSGVGIAGSFVSDPLSYGPKPHLAFEEPVLNVVAQTDATLALEGGRNGGGGLNGLCLDTSSGAAQLATELRDLGTASAGTPNLGITAFSLGRLPAPGVTVLGGQLMIVPDGILNLTIASGPVVFVAPVFTPEGIFAGPSVPVPAGTAATFHAQGFVLDLLSLLAQETQVWSVTTL